MKSNYLEWLLYLSIAILIVWAVLKSIGVIHSPVWIEMIPFISIGIGIGAGFTQLKNMLSNIMKSLKELKSEHTD